MNKSPAPARQTRDRKTGRWPKTQFPFFGLLLSPVIAGAAKSLGSVSVIANALRLRRWRASMDRIQKPGVLKLLLLHA
jgi:hypothetical protein